MPEVSRLASIEEPWIKATIMTPDEFLGPVLTLCTERRGEQIDLTYAGNRAMAVYRLPLNEVVFDFYDRLKSITRGYASFDYTLDSYREGDLVKVSILVNGDLVDARTLILGKLLADVFEAREGVHARDPVMLGNLRLEIRRHEGLHEGCVRFVRLGQHALLEHGLRPVVG